ncbi:MAG TPA: hypothetical protein VGY54_23660, partial [Polyangiaceae bacterium]|nr:hypothetical protein [Polyangiaceae bacterium]
TPLVTAANTAPGTHFGDNEEGGLPTEGIHFITATPDLSHVVLSSRGKFLTSEGGAPSPYYFYEWVEGKLKLIDAFPSNLPGNFYFGGSAEIGLGDTNVRHAISDDGARIFWSTPGGVFMRDAPAGESVLISAAQGVPSTGGGIFQYASSDGSRAFFSTGYQLTTAPGGGLYVYEAETGKLTLVTVPLNASEPTKVLGLVPGASEDGSYVYVVAQGVLSANENTNREKAVSGANNLYVLHGETAQGGGTRWSASFIAALSNEDWPSWDGHYNGSYVNMPQLVSRASPNGRYFAFMSERSLTGYDNRDAVSGQPDEEVYEYDAASGRLACVSCDPTGARPEGRQQPEGTKVDPPEVWRGRWIAGSVPGWFEAFRGFEVANYQPHYLSDSGRIFFDSSAGLVTQDVNGTEDVYQYEPSDVGSCAQAQGCVSLLSGGTGPDESVFQDASASGEDVFFLTVDRLVSEDFDNAYDMYDAHVCGAQAPCFPARPALPPSCNSGDSCKPAPSPQPPVFGAPASATFSGEGNLTPQPAATVTLKKGPTRAQRLARALRACRLVHGKRKRTACERSATKRYGQQAGRAAGRPRAYANMSRRAGR